MKFKNRMILSLLFITFIPLILSYSIFLSDKIGSNNENIENNLLEVSKLVATNPEICKNLEARLINGTIQKEIEDYIEIFRDVDIIVVADIEGIKYSHLDKSQIGTTFVNPVRWNSILEKTGYFSKMRGSMGITFRRFEPIFNQQKDIIGFVMVGKYYETIFQMNQKTIERFILLFLGVFLMSLLLAIRYADKMKNILYGLEPEEIGRLYNEEKLITDNLESGLIALDKDNKISKINSVFFKKFPSIPPEVIVENILKYLKFDGHLVKNVEVIIDNERLFIKILPIYSNQGYYGTTLLIRRYNEVDSYAREITGIDQLVEGMRANIHEFKNRLHVILGLVNLGKLEMVKKYILEAQELNEYDFKKLKNIKNPFIKAILIGKAAVAKERKIDLIIEPDSIISEENNTELLKDLGTILANLLENALDSFKQSSQSQKIIKVRLIENKKFIEAEVWDNGIAIPTEILDKIYEYGFSTKGNQRGVGLYLITEKLKLYNGKINLEQGSDFKIFKIKMER